jgi:uncharacterized protein YjiS (DUF1127 family)
MERMRTNRLYREHKITKLRSQEIVEVKPEALACFMLTRDGRWQMSDRYNERPDFQYYIEQAHGARAEAMARVGYLAVGAVGRVVGAAARPAQAAFAALTAWRNRQAAVREILLLDDRMLRDIGLTRADAWAAVDGTLGTRNDYAPDPADNRDVALSDYALAGCNDNGDRRQAA